MSAVNMVGRPNRMSPMAAFAFIAYNASGAFDKVCLPNFNSCVSGASTAVNISLKEEQAGGLADTSYKGMDHKKAAKYLKKTLQHNSLDPYRVSMTTDGSVLMQYLGTNEGCVDVFPNGDVIVILRKGDLEEIHELQYQDTKRMVSLLKSARVG